MIYPAFFQSKAPTSGGIEPEIGVSDPPGHRRHQLTALLLALMMLLVPALGVPVEELLQDTLKSALVSLFALAASLSYFWAQRARKRALHFHVLLCFPLLLMAYALGSMAWSHAYFGGVEAIRWFVFGLLLFLGANTLTLPRVTQLAWGIHLGAVVASLWAALQFWFDLSLFPQLVIPASTFVNRNFFAEFLVCTFPFSILLMSRVQKKAIVFLLLFSLGFNVVALMMTGTRSALVSTLLMVLSLPLTIGLYRKQFVTTGWRLSQLIAMVALLVSTVWSLGSIETANPKLIAESGQGDAIDRAIKRTLSVGKADEYTHGSFSIRTRLWKASVQIILTNAVTGVGAGAWQIQEPDSGVKNTTAYYAHNEILQLLAEYGLVGWLALLGLLTYLLWAAYRTWSDQSQAGQQEALLRTLTLTSLLMLLIVSNAGFPWHLASTGAIFALSLAILAASDIRLGVGRAVLWRALPWRARYGNGTLGAAVLCTALALYIVQQAFACEAKLVRAFKVARTIAQSGRPEDPRWEQAKAEIHRLMREGIAINPHYRLITPLVADELASWGDWENAAWIWESVLASRPNIVAITTNVSRAYLQMGDYPKALAYFDRALKLQPGAPAVRALHALLLTQSGQYPQAAQIVRELLQARVVDDSVMNLTYLLGTATRDWALTIAALELRIQTAPMDVADDWLNLGNVYNKPEVNNPAQALASYRAALHATASHRQYGVWAKIPPDYRERLQATVPP